MSHFDDLEKLIEKHTRRLKMLKERQAIEGSSIDPAIKIEIEDIEAKIERLNREKEEKYKGSYIVELLDSLDPEGLTKTQGYYQTALTEIIPNPDFAIERCETALEALKENNDFNAPIDRGKFYLLLASIYLNEDKKNLKLAEKHYWQSRKHFHMRQWSHLEGLAEFGLALTQYELKRPEEALQTLDRANNLATQESITFRIDRLALTNLRNAINKEIDKLLDSFSPATSRLPLATEKSLSVFRISDGEQCIGLGGTIDLNLLSLEDYEQNVLEKPEVVIMDATKRQSIRKADYILEIDDKVNKTLDGLQSGDWLLIQSSEDPQALNGRTVAVFVKEHTENDETTSAGLKTFSPAGDHYFLKSQNSNPSLIITHYKSGDVSRINEYYAGHARINEILAFDARVSGKVIDRIPKQSTEKITKAFLWQIPVLRNIADGQESPIAEEDVEGYIELKRAERKQGIYFAIAERVKETPDDNFLSYALIHQQEDIENGALAVMVIITSEEEIYPEEIKKYNFYNKREDLQHWYLEASSTEGEHCVVMPEGTDTTAIRAMYQRMKPDSKVRFIENAELIIFGKYIETIKVEKEYK